MIEPLEARIAPAGIIDVIVKNGSLILKTLPAGDGDENITIGSPTPGDFIIDPDIGTTLRVNGTELPAGDAATIEGITKNITIALGNGNDTIDFRGDVGGKLAIDLGAGNNTLTLRPGLYGGDVAIKGGVGNDTVRTLQFDVNSPDPFYFAGNVTVQLSEGNNSLSLTANGSPGIAATTTIARNLTVTSGAGDDNLSINGAHSFTVGGNLTFASGKGLDDLSVNLGDTLAVGKNLTFLSLGGANSVTQSIVSQRGPTIGGKVALIATADSTVTQEFTASALPIKVAGAVNFTAKAKDAVTQTISANGSDLAVGGALTFKGDSGSVTQTVDGARLFLNGAVTLAATGPMPPTSMVFAPGEPQEAFFFTAQQNLTTDAVVDSSGSSVKGPVKLTGAAEVFINVVGEIRGPVTIATRPTYTSAEITIGVESATHLTRFLGPVKITSAATITDTFAIASSVFANTVTINAGRGVSTIDVTDSAFLKAVTINGSLGNDTVNWEVGALADRDGYVLGALKFIGGDGTDTLRLGGESATDTAIFLGKVTYDGGTGIDRYSFGSFARALLEPVLKNVEPV